MNFKSIGHGPSQKQSSSSESLSKVYKEIAFRALLVENWPDATTSNRLFRRDDQGYFQIPSFPVAEAPLAVVALLDQIPGASRIVDEGDQMFELFLKDVKNIIATSTTNGINGKKTVNSDLEKNVWRSIRGTHHITIAVFQEHPSLLFDEAARQRCRLVSEDVAQQIFSEIIRRQQNNQNFVAPVLQLDSLVITGDGVMIAGFVDQTRDSFQNIRVSSSQIAEAIIGDLTSRPKKLIHATLGRVLELPGGTNQLQQNAINQLIREYNTKILPEKVASLQKTLPNEASFVLSEAFMIRDVVWTLRKIKPYGSWQFQVSA